MSSHILSFFALFRPRKSISTIVSPMNKILRDLDTYAKQQSAEAAKAVARAEALNALADTSRSEASAALALASNYQALITPKI